MDTLVLNAQFMPISTVSARKAFVYWLKDKAQILHEYEDKHLGTFDGAFNAPAVVKLIHFIKPPRKISRHLPFTRKNIWVRDNGECQYCHKDVSKKEFTFDHVIPRHKGGKRRWDNIVCACKPCNSRKANRTPAEAGMKLARRPFAPPLPFKKEREIMLGIKDTLKKFPHASWQNYIYWNITLESE